MMISQLIYTSTMTDAVTPEMAYNMSAHSVGMCQQLGLTGRVFADNQQALVMMEGPTDIVQRYYRTVSEDARVETIMLHTDRKIKAREFRDYSVWLNLKTPIEFSDTVLHLSRESLNYAMPKIVSARLRIMIEAYITPKMLTE